MLNLLRSFHPLPVAIVKAYPFNLHLGLDILKESLQFVHVSGLLWPADTEAFGLIWLRDLETSNS